MSKDSNIKSYTATDIEKYHKGLLSPREMHDLEKAALDDPFLADALEGYAVSGINATADIAELKKRLSDRTEENRKVIPLAAPSRSSFPWLRAAAMLVLVLGAAFLVYQFGFNKNSSPLAKSENKPVTATEDSNHSSDFLKSDSQKEVVSSLIQQTDSSTVASRGVIQNPGITSAQKPNAQANQGDIVAVPDTIARISGELDDIYYKNKNQVAVAPPPPVKGEATYESLEKKLEDERAQGKQNQFQFRKESNVLPVAKAKTENKNFSVPRKQTDTVIANGYAMRDKEAAAPYRGNAYENQTNVSADDLKTNNASRINIFRGQVIDADKNVVPFANITNRADNIGTYTDAKGNFTLTSPDSVLNVQVRSLGFENNYSQLNNGLLNNQVVMQEDRSLKEVVVSQKKINSTRSRTSTMVLEEPEPVDGWTNYDVYLANNLNVPETWRSRQTEGAGVVTLSFEVNSKGQPVNITVDKSLCESCDKEAIRLIKEGPKWKRKSRKGRTSVTISF